MKRILITILVCVMSTLSVHASPWAEMYQSVSSREDPERKGYSRYKPEQVSVMPRILKGEPVRVNIELPKNFTAADCEAAKQQVSNAYNSWFKNANDTINAQHREQEFQDVQPTLQKGVKVQADCIASGSANATTTPSDLTVSFGNSTEEIKKECKTEDAYGCQIFGEDGKSMKLIMPAKDSDLNDSQKNHVLLHEIGHALGMADAYEQGYRENASGRHRSKWRTPDSIMRGLSDDKTEPPALTADDADGLINIIDSWNIHDKKELSERVTKGWAGLDRFNGSGSSKDRYRMGTSEKVLSDPKFNSWR